MISQVAKNNAYFSRKITRKSVRMRILDQINFPLDWGCDKGFKGATYNTSCYDNMDQATAV